MSCVQVGSPNSRAARSRVRQEPKLDELEQYLEDPEEPELDVKVLQWWAAKESKWPNLAKMAKQYFCPSGILGRGGARLLRCRQDAQRSQEVGQGGDARAFDHRSVQH